MVRRRVELLMRLDWYCGRAIEIIALLCEYFKCLAIASNCKICVLRRAIVSCIAKVSCLCRSNKLPVRQWA